MLLVLVVFIGFGFGFHAANATMRSLTPQEQAATCYPSSPMLYSDACGGVPFMGGFPQSSNYQTQQNDPFSQMYVLMNALQGQTGGGVDAMMGLNLDPTMMWQHNSPMGNSPMLNATAPIVR
tara:strand:- start:4392 stop:4757 length:366 start_codon:yes stop_codon:yes gene_type:complete